MKAWAWVRAAVLLVSGAPRGLDGQPSQLPRLEGCTAAGTARQQLRLAKFDGVRWWTTSGLWSDDLDSRLKGLLRDSTLIVAGSYCPLNGGAPLLIYARIPSGRDSVLVSLPSALFARRGHLTSSVEVMTDGAGSPAFLSEAIGDAVYRIRDVREVIAQQKDSAHRAAIAFEQYVRAESLRGIAEDERRTKERNANAATEARQSRERAAASELARRRRVERYRKFGWSNEAIKRIVAEKAWVGMTKAQLREAWGRPRSVNETLSASGTSEQWVYHLGQIAYVDNGVVTALQVTR